MKEQSRESDFIQNPDISFIRDGTIDLKQTGKCYDYSMEQVKEIQKLCEARYSKKTTYKKNGWYYIIQICK